MARGMGSESRNRNGDARKHVAAENDVSATAAKVVRSVKEIVNCAEEEIYAALKECDMDANRAVEKLLAQGAICGVKTGTSSDSRVVQSGFTYETYNEHEKAIDKGEGGSVYPSVMLPTTHVERKNTKSAFRLLLFSSKLKWLPKETTAKQHKPAEEDAQVLGLGGIGLGWCVIVSRHVLQLVYVVDAWNKENVRIGLCFGSL